MAAKNSPDVVSALKLPFTPTLARIPNLTFTGAAPTLGASGPGSFGPYRDYNRNHTGFANVTKTIGGHPVKIRANHHHFHKPEKASGHNAASLPLHAQRDPTRTP